MFWLLNPYVQFSSVFGIYGGGLFFWKGEGVVTHYPYSNAQNV